MSDKGRMYQIRVKGHLDPDFAAWLHTMVINHEADGNTLITIALADQSALNALLNRLHDLCIILISVTPVDDSEEG
ncbi:MAG: hypothetical protein RLP44_30060 [Aggregatilineales bacterium]